MTREQLQLSHNNMCVAVKQTNDSAKQLIYYNSVQSSTKQSLLDRAAEQEGILTLLSKSLKDNSDALALLNTVKDKNTTQSYAFIEHNLNLALEKVFDGSIRKIKLVEGALKGKYPELRLELTAENNVKRNLKADEGHGIRQIVSLLCTLCLICISGARRFLILDEVLTGLSCDSREAVDDILWTFTQIGFQFVVVEHNFIAKNSKVYELQLENGISHVTDSYVLSEGFYAERKTDKETNEAASTDAGTTEATAPTTEHD